MNILITNDDGIKSEGLVELAKAIQEKGHKITVFAPSQQNSGKSHSITLFQKIYVNKVDFPLKNCEAYEVTGTPADCVRAAMSVVGEKFDFCFSGSNIGYNAGMDIVYSGTVSAAIEANIYKIPAIAVSAEYNPDIPNLADHKVSVKVAMDVFEKVKNILKEPIVLNVNTPFVPYEKLKGLKVCKVGCSITDKYEVYENGKDKHTIELVGRNPYNNPKDTDRYFLEEGYATLTPLNYNLTSEELLEETNEIF